MSMRPVHWVNRGRFDAAGLLLFPALIGEPEAKRRLLALWTPGMTAHQLDGAWVIRFEQPRSFHTASAPGTVLIGHKNGLVEPPLSPLELRQQDGGSVVRILGATASSLEPGAALKPESWLDLSAFSEPAVHGLTAPPEPVKAVAVKRVTRESYGLKSEDPAVRELVDALAKRKRQGAALAPQTNWLDNLLSALSTAPQAKGNPSAMMTAIAAPIAGAFALGAWFGSLFATPAPMGDAVNVANAPAPEAGWFQQVIQQMQLRRMFGNTQADHLQDVLQRFEEGDFAEALRRAIPLGGEGTGSTSWSFSPLGRRNDLTIGGATSGAGGGLPLEGGFYNVLEAAYKRAAKKLEAAGDLDKAAFVLAELLERPEDAVRMLARHDRYELAAKIAEARELHPALCVRMWMLAGDVERAVATAIRNDAFRAAILRLLQEPDVADRLRLIYAERLANAGQFAAAIAIYDELRTVPTERSEVLAAGIAAGGPSGAALRMMRLGEDSAMHEVDLAVLTELLSTGGSETLAERRSAITKLHGNGHPQAGQLAAIATRTLMVDARVLPVTTQELQLLIHKTGDPVFAADLPSFARIKSKPLHTTIQGSLDMRRKAGGLRIYDAVVLANGRFVLAHGDNGVRITTALGRTVHWIDIPVFYLVLPDTGHQLIGIGSASAKATRHPIHSLTRIDAQNGTASPWCDAQLSGWASSFDGSLWFTAEAQRVNGIDVAAPGMRAVWSVPMKGASGLKRNRRWLSFMAEEECFSYALPEIRLRQRERMPSHLVVTPIGLGIAAQARLNEATPSVLLEFSSGSAMRKPDCPPWQGFNDDRHPTGTPHPGGHSFSVAFAEGADVTEAYVSETGGRWVAINVCSEEPGEDRVSLISMEETPRLRLTINVSEPPQVRIQGDTILLFANGHLMAVNLWNGTPVADFVVT